MPAQPFKLASKHSPVGDQPGAIDSLCRSIEGGSRYQTLLGVTGSGKTFSMANVIARLNRPTIIIAHNKTLAAQLYGEFKKFFPDNAVEYFVSFYDYYQPEAYVPRTDTFIEKDMQINDQIDRMRHSATRSLLDRQDVVIVASVSCIYGLGSPEAYAGALVFCEIGDEYPRREMLKKLVEIAYKRNDFDLKPGTFRVRGDTLDVFPMYEDSKVIRFEFFGDEVDAILEIDSLTGEIYGQLEKVTIYPATHYVTPESTIERACATIRAERDKFLRKLNKEGKLLEAQRIDQRTNYDLETLEQTGTCYGIENYSAHLEQRGPGEKPPTLLDYLPKNAIIMIDESHQTIPQFGGMYKGDRSRKETLVEHGFRLPSAMDNRPLKFEEFEGVERPTVFVSATPGPYEIEKTPESAIAEQIIRPTGLIDPPIEVRPIEGQVDDLMEQIRQTVERRERVLVCTLTKRMAEELTEYFDGLGIRVRYLHSEIDTLERMDLLRGLRKGDYDVLIGINLLREGLDLPEVSLVAVLDADKEGFLRSDRSLIQIVGRAARNANGHVIFYADKVTDSMQRCIDETDRRREKQQAYNDDHDITPQTIISPLQDSLREIIEADFTAPDVEEDTVAEAMRKRGKGNKNLRQRKLYNAEEAEKVLKEIVPEAYEEESENRDSIEDMIAKLTKAMEEAAEKLEFEKAALLRDEIKELQALDLGLRV